jgi:hypothetical protein
MGVVAVEALTGKVGAWSQLAWGSPLMARNYWLDLFTGTTWEEFQSAGGEVSGFRERRWKQFNESNQGTICSAT